MIARYAVKRSGRTSRSTPLLQFKPSQHSRHPRGTPSHHQGVFRKVLKPLSASLVDASNPSSSKQDKKYDDEPLFRSRDRKAESSWGQVECRKFNTWADKEAMVKCEKALVQIPPGAERGLYAEDDISTGDMIVSVPSLMLLKVTNSPKEKCPTKGLVDEELWSSSPWYIRLAYLLLEKVKLQPSDWKPYISALPERFETPIHWNHDQLKDLHYPYLLERVDLQKADLRRRCEAFKNGKSGISLSMSSEELIWATECVRSRSFMGPNAGDPRTRILRQIFLFGLAGVYVAQGGDFGRVIGAVAAASIFGVVSDVIISQNKRQFIMPVFADMANHRSQAKDTQADVNFWSGDVTVFAGSDVRKGDEIFFSYGAKSNDALLQYYGFVEENNPNDVYVFDSFEKKIEESRVIPSSSVSTRLKQLRDKGWSPALESVSLNAKGQPTLLSAKVLNLIFGTAEIDSYESVLEQTKRSTPSSSDLDGDDDGSPMLSKNARTAMGLMCRAELDQMPTSLEEDLSLYEELKTTVNDKDDEDSVALRKSMTVGFRIGKKRILTQCVSNS
mmetsp:Transcript_3308/g.5112  ORF Transcript_3308/g.5112 Transcript_3308/m.5112 type:complete len:559 (-) Transcript_3308:88-1764(-)